MIIAKFVFVAILGYLLGSIPFGYFMAKLIRKVDVREYGSGKTGGTNLLRTVGLKIASASAAMDVIKAMLAVTFAGLILGDDSLIVGGALLNSLDARVIAASAAIAGHIWPVFIRFRGGRGVATFYGGMLLLCYEAAIASGIILLITIALTRYASLGSIVGAIFSYVILVTLVVIRGYPVEYLLFAFFAAVIIAVAHRDNIIRLVTGSELRIGQKAKKRVLRTFTSKGAR